MVERDGHDEGTQRRLTAKTGDRARKSDEGVLHHVLGDDVIAEEPPGKRTHVRVMRIVGLAEGAEIAALEASDESRFDAVASAVHDDRRERYTKRGRFRRHGGWYPPRVGPFLRAGRFRVNP